MASRVEIVVTFLALLELIRLRQVRATQQSPFDEIEIAAGVALIAESHAASPDRRMRLRRARPRRSCSTTPAGRLKAGRRRRSQPGVVGAMPYRCAQSTSADRDAVARAATATSMRSFMREFTRRRRGGLPPDLSRQASAISRLLFRERSSFSPAARAFTRRRTGEWVTEESAAEPERETGRICARPKSLVLAQRRNRRSFGRHLRPRAFRFAAEVSGGRSGDRSDERPFHQSGASRRYRSCAVASGASDIWEEHLPKRRAAHFQRLRQSPDHASGMLRMARARI